MTTRHPPRILPEWVRDIGIATQKELVMALLPYLTWCSKRVLRTWFLEILPHAETSPKKSSALDRQILELLKKGLIERTYMNIPLGVDSLPNATPRRHAYYRRISKELPRTEIGKAWLAGTYGTKPKKVPKRKSRHTKTNAHLTEWDLDFIRGNPHIMSTRRLAEMHGICQTTAWRITRGVRPKHLKGQYKRQSS